MEGPLYSITFMGPEARQAGGRVGGRMSKSAVIIPCTT